MTTSGRWWTRPSWGWSAVRVLLLSAACLRNVFAPAAVTTPSAADGIGAAPPWLMLAFGAVGIPLILIARLAGSTPWQRPGWRGNPFQLKQPLQFFHFAAFFFMAQGAGSLVRQAMAGLDPTKESLVWFAWGAGILVGVVVSTRLYRRKMETSAVPAA
jgi:hypothetical protein